MEHQGPQERNDSGNQPVVQRREKSGAKNSNSSKQEGEGVNGKAPQGHIHKSLVIPNKDLRQGPCQDFSSHQHRHRADSYQHQTSFQQAFQFPVVARAIVIPNDWRRAYRVPNEGRQEAINAEAALNGTITLDSCETVVLELEK